MEAAAVAWACELHKTPFFCLKVVTDLVDGGGVGEVSVAHPHIILLQRGG